MSLIDRGMVLVAKDGNGDVALVLIAFFQETSALQTVHTTNGG